MHRDSLEIDAEEVPFSSICRNPTTHYVVADGKLRELPLKDFLEHWEDFESLIARLVTSLHESTVRNVFRYGRQGQKQHGIDVIAINPRSGTTSVFQCKHVKSITRGEMAAWVKLFLEGSLQKQVNKFVLCTPYSIESDTALVDEWRRCAFALAEQKIDSELWDNGKLQQLLRQSESVVIEFFGEEVAKRFCIPIQSVHSDLYTSKYRTKFSAKHGSSLVVENETTRLDLILPGNSQSNLSAQLSFARSDLNGASLGLDAEELVYWLQWRIHAENDEDRPYATKLPEGGQWVFASKSVRLILNDQDLADLDWVLKKAWEHFKEAITLQEAKWRTLRFAKLESPREGNAYAIVAIDRDLWRMMIEFARHHDCAEGDTEWHIFDAAPGVLKVYVHQSTARLDSGYHLILYAYNEEGIALPWERDLILGWTPLTSVGGTEESFSPRKAWDAEFTHDWLMNAFIPEVLRWTKQKNRKAINFEGLFGRDKLINSADWCRSLAVCDYRELSVIPNDLVGVRTLASQLQSHFNGTSHEPQIDRQLTNNVLSFLERIVPYANPLDEYYLRSKLPLDDSLSVQNGLRKLLENNTQ